MCDNCSGTYLLSQFSLLPGLSLQGTDFSRAVPQSHRNCRLVYSSTSSWPWIYFVIFISCSKVLFEPPLFHAITLSIYIFFNKRYALSSLKYIGITYLQYSEIWLGSLLRTNLVAVVGAGQAEPSRLEVWRGGNRAADTRVQRLPVGIQHMCFAPLVQILSLYSRTKGETAEKIF